MMQQTGVDPTIGLILVRPAQILGAEPFYHELIAGLDGTLGPAGLGLLLQVVSSAQEEDETYTRWVKQGSVVAVLLVDLTRSDRRVPLLRSLGLQAVIVGDPQTAGGYPAVWTDDAGAMRNAVRHLTALGHRRICHVSGPGSYAHSQIRAETLTGMALELGITAVKIESNYSEEDGDRATRSALEMEDQPTAIIYDDDLMALGGLQAASELGVNVPEMLSVLTWDDSILCHLSKPKLSAMSHDIQAIGELAARAVIELLKRGKTTNHEAAMAVLVTRGSTAPPPSPLAKP